MLKAVCSEVTVDKSMESSAPTHVDIGSDLRESPAASTRWKENEIRSNKTIRKRRGLSSAFAACMKGASESFSRDWSWNDVGEFEAQTSISEEEAHQQALAIDLYRTLAETPVGEVSPGDRRESLSFLGRIAQLNPTDFYPALAVALSASERRISDEIKSSVVGVAGLLPELRIPGVTTFLLSEVLSDSPSRASAAALSLSEVADVYSVPAMKLAASKIRWKIARADLADAIQTITNSQNELRQVSEG
jgi:hypothetical protein